MRSSFMLIANVLLVFLFSGCAEICAIMQQNAEVAAVAGVDSDTDAVGIGAQFNMAWILCNLQADANSPLDAIHAPETIPSQVRSAPPITLRIVPGIFYGRGSQDFGDADPMTGEPLSYSVLQLGVHGQYPIPLTEGGMVSAYPLVGPAFYRFSYSDCPAGVECNENIFLVDVGGGVQYGNFGLEAFTGLGGPKLRVRAKYVVPL